MRKRWRLEHWPMRLGPTPAGHPAIGIDVVFESDAEMSDFSAVAILRDMTYGGNAANRTSMVRVYDDPVQATTTDDELADILRRPGTEGFALAEAMGKVVEITDERLFKPWTEWNHLFHVDNRRFIEKNRDLAINLKSQVSHSNNLADMVADLTYRVEELTLRLRVTQEARDEFERRLSESQSARLHVAKERDGKSSRIETLHQLNRDLADSLDAARKERDEYKALADLHEKCERANWEALMRLGSSKPGDVIAVDDPSAFNPRTFWQTHE